jgi:dihydroflavonol-4-reductase
MHFDSSRAVRELGLPQSPVEAAIARAVAWFRENGYAP